MSRFASRFVAVMVVLFPSLAAAQGVLIDARKGKVFEPRRPIIRPVPQPIPRPRIVTTYHIKQLDVDVNLKDQVAKLQVSQTVVNPGNQLMQVEFVFPLPHDGAVSQLTFLVDGKEYEGKLMKSNEARKIYEGYVRKFQDPALVEWIGWGMFKTSVFPVPPGKERKVTLRYNQLAEKSRGLIDFRFPLSTAKHSAKPLEALNIRVNVQSKERIKNIYSPTHDVKIERPEGEHAVVKYEGKDVTPEADFRLLYDTAGEKVGASLLSYKPSESEEGYFVLLASPGIVASSSEQPKKTVVFVVDRSGSMSGKKIEQAKGALRFVLNNLREGDTFNIVAYDSIVETFQPELQKFNDQSRKQALGFVSGIYAGGSTNIDGALKTALGMLKDKERPSYVIFLTDGLPTQGEKNAAKIVQNAVERNNVRARIFNFGVGYDVNSRMLDKLSQACFGQSQYVRPNEDIESHVSRLYDRIGSPALSKVAIQFDSDDVKTEEGKLVNRVYPQQAYDLFAGQQLVMVGRYRKPADVKVVIRGEVNGLEQQFDFAGELQPASSDSSQSFIAKLWAVRRVGQIIERIDLHGKSDELVDELVSLATKHGIVTPYTSFLADDKPSTPVLGGPRPLSAARRAADDVLRELKEESGKRSFGLRKTKADFKQAQLAPTAGAAKYRDAETGREVTVNTIKNVGAKTFYRRGDRWIDSEVTAEEMKRAVKVKRYSDQYFALIDKYGRDAAKYLASEGDVYISLGDKVYAF